MIKRWGKWSVDTDEFTISLEKKGRLRLFTIPPKSEHSPEEVFNWIVRPRDKTWLDDTELKDLRSALHELLWPFVKPGEGRESDSLSKKIGPRPSAPSRSPVSRDAVLLSRTDASK
jgi:hypothetical protein